MSLRFTNAQLALLALCLLLTLAFFYELFALLRPYTPSRVDIAHASYSVAMPASYTPPSFETFANIDERSVFNPLRTPIQTESAGIAKSAADTLPADLALVGVIIDSHSRTALLKSPDAPQAVAVPQGEEFDGWLVQSVEPDRVVFTAHGEQQELKLSDNKANAGKGKSGDDDDSSDSDDSSDNAKPPAQALLRPAPQPVQQDHTQDATPDPQDNAKDSGGESDPNK